MTTYLTPKRPVFQARRYDPNAQDSSAAALETWLVSMGGAETVVATVSPQGFSLELTHSYEGTQTVSGGVGDWIVSIQGSIFPEVMTDGNILANYDIVN